VKPPQYGRLSVEAFPLLGGRRIAGANQIHSDGIARHRYTNDTSVIQQAKIPSYNIMIHIHYTSTGACAPEIKAPGFGMWSEKNPTPGSPGPGFGHMN
jgi:hypothetical protein